ncbi:L-threonylcarbamoyladenylate synthase [Pedobacter nanyangensis]|uniref:L-threonylcarbamoyladenylate synthase n=1 Tax=Pedobacter nanyangensis TaxID=1562389 RepID=UPI000DE259DD|nr:L-threonylcarbamoyladenylate synthase [Pedobacter nanyangensis]
MISDNIALAADMLKQGCLVAIPTETVYGLAANIYNENAIKAIYDAKNRPLHTPLIVHIKGIECLETIANTIPSVAIRLAERYWPGPLTLLLEKNRNVSDLVTAGYPRVAVRVPDHPVALALLNQIDFPLAAPSTNPFGGISSSRAEHVEAHFKDLIGMVLQVGSCKRGIESNIVGFDGNQTIIYRLGSLPIEEIQEVVEKVVLINKAVQSPVAPGMLARHYGPETPLIFTKNIRYEVSRLKDNKVGLLLFNEALIGLPAQFKQKVLSANGNLTEAATILYETMHELDKVGLDYIVAEQFPEEGMGIVINDKLGRGSNGGFLALV